ncbi:hypothetical protein A0J61_07933 [Choanephora cucurbitarum]|uniref:Uncharacterized protein n=1 Tax=Choanephora cucurbitarum TaxID=101091 RepID=A0A1C7N5W0_9FUNG|nr:hypothetical protein A0J61_07933 [Choanephora cucurbitarum]
MAKSKSAIQLLRQGSLKKHRSSANLKSSTIPCFEPKHLVFSSLKAQSHLTCENCSLWQVEAKLVARIQLKQDNKYTSRFDEHEEKGEEGLKKNLICLQTEDKTIATVTNIVDTTMKETSEGKLEGSIINPFIQVLLKRNMFFDSH